ncbi:uncharacterized protein BDZ99DRAFT_523224 [Mytilinidion resinicola]|uniref:C2H2-type domain-containing protein n=1 Tax=Mytilinidion resinicola TaxID=574789 RepID=A0A6A6YDN7_9PEZI|nr:uncharacterized protein BDZ99DRAFT_523224 [Mytilinidion resinicola]KAF2806643.1 hypothetical protein BDZ99DRAFT_523224 [Mytilinidion resinicola]
MASSTDPIDLTTERNLEPALLEAIGSAKASTLRQILIEVCMKSEVGSSLVREAMLVPGHVDTAANASSTTKKRKLEKPVARFAHCVQCEKDFDVLLNEKQGQEQACQRHDGELELDEDAFPDDDDLNDGHVLDVDTDWRVNVFPQHFTWSCCEQKGREAFGCVRSRHSRSHTGEGQGTVYYRAKSGGYETEDHRYDD